MSKPNPALATLLCCEDLRHWLARKLGKYSRFVSGVEEKVTLNCEVLGGFFLSQWPVGVFSGWLVFNEPMLPKNQQTKYFIGVQLIVIHNLDTLAGGFTKNIQAYYSCYRPFASEKQVHSHLNNFLFEHPFLRYIFLPPFAVNALMKWIYQKLSWAL